MCINTSDTWSRCSTEEQTSGRLLVSWMHKMLKLKLAQFHSVVVIRPTLSGCGAIERFWDPRSAVYPSAYNLAAAGVEAGLWG